MILNKIKQMKKEDRGFTIVELLIVIVIIAILAAITIVAYNGIQNRANAATAKSNAESVQKVAEAYAIDENGGNGNYATLAQLNTWSGVAASLSRIPTGVTLIPGALSATHKDGKSIQYMNKGTTGACIGYWDASLNTHAYVYAGNAVTGGNATPATCI